MKKQIYIAPSADVVGNVELGENSSVWYQAVLRGDNEGIRIGKNSNIQDGTVVHTDAGYPVCIGDNVTVGHNAIIHGCQVEDDSLVGMGAILLNGCRIGRHCLIGAGALITQNTVIPDGSLVLGSPGKVVRRLTPKEQEGILRSAAEYVEAAKRHFSP